MLAADTRGIEEHSRDSRASECGIDDLIDDADLDRARDATGNDLVLGSEL